MAQLAQFYATNNCLLKICVCDNGLSPLNVQQTLNIVIITYVRTKINVPISKRSYIGLLNLRQLMPAHNAGSRGCESQKSPSSVLHILNAALSLIRS